MGSMSKRMNITIKTVAELVDAFGGTQAFADWADVGMSAVSNWIAMGAVPRGYHYRLDRECRARHLDVDPGFFDRSPKWPEKPKKSVTADAAA